MDDFIKMQVNRLAGLLNPERTKIELQPIGLEIAPSELGAETGFGYTTPSEDAHFAIYIFKNWDEHQKIAKRLKSSYEDDDTMYVRTVTNGSMLLFARTPIRDDEDDIDAQVRIGNIISAFAGDE